MTLPHNMQPSSEPDGIFAVPLSLINAKISKLPVAHKLGLLMSTITFLTLSILWLIVSYHLSAVLEQRMNILGQTIATQTSASAAEMVLAEDLLSLSVILSQAVQAEDILYARIRDVKDTIIAESSNGPFPVDNPLPNNLALYSAPITFQDVTAGYSDIVIDKTSIDQAIKQSIHWMTLATLLLLALSILFAMFLGRNITEPIMTLIQATVAIRKGHLDFRIKKNRADELGILIDSFNDMAAGLKERHQMKDALNRYMDPNIADTLMVHLDNSFVPMGHAHVTILFIDIVSFTPMCEHLSPEEVANVLNIYYECIHKSCITFGGVVDKFIGDGAMVLFGAPKQDPEHCFNAICAAYLFLKLTQKITEQAESLTELKQFHHIQYRLGIHTGAVIAGSLGGKDRLQYTAVGDTVNIASRICQISEPNCIYLSEGCYKQAFGEKRMQVKHVGPCSVKGKTEEIEICLLESMDGPHEQLINKKASFLIEQIKATLLTNKLDNDDLDAPPNTPN